MVFTSSSDNMQSPIHLLRLFSLIFVRLILLQDNWQLIGQHVGSVNGDIFSSTSHLQNLMYLERHLIMSLGKYVVNMEQKLSKIRRYIEGWEATAGRDEFVGTYGEEEIIGNPLQAFQLVKRLTIDWRGINELFKQDQWQEVRKLTHDYKAIMPTDDDLHGAALAIVRLQDTYNLTNTELANGIIQEHATHITMTARDCLYLAKHAFNNAYYGHSLDWFEEALSRAYKEGNTTASVSEIQPFYKMATQVVDQFKKENEGSLDTYHIYMEASGSREHSTKFRMLEDDNEDYRRFQALCRGERQRSAKDTSKLKCYLTHNNNPYLYLQPIKLEVQNIDPYIAIIHNLMTEKETATIREIAAPLLTRARVQTDNGTSDMISKTRTSQTAWFSPETHPIVTRINKRIDAATGLSADMTDSHCELMQVANYGMGGHYTPHYDYLIVDRPEEERDQVDERELYAGDRTATVMFYLSDVIRGGSTVFPRLNVHLKPELGSAAFWYNLYKNGEGIIDTVHGACPVLMGEKWVANFWIRERGQFSRRRCSLNPKE
ncbi:Prolyl 4-hydroxylase subunit alpha-1 [Fragariocoptes setiger]|uniref:procollagen-proline 4-dioxygenase n=1 Tax=Fragariocoptes setiger TaxID=1670756 RepID=A0ABQ7SAK8_9ACAR|nr:Prolyl 4-hydroxylase subunit alpha-1 [Fragariocoptes setiger]